MKLYLLLMGLIAVYVAVVAVPAFYFGADANEIISFVQSNALVAGIGGAIFLAGLVFLFFSGILFAREPSVDDYPEECPSCGESLPEEDQEEGSCSECRASLQPRRFSLDSAGLTGGIIALLLLALLAGSPFIGLSAVIAATLLISALACSGTSLLMGLCSVIAERRKIGIAFIGVIINSIVLGVSIYILM